MSARRLSIDTITTLDGPVVTGPATTVASAGAASTASELAASVPTANVTVLNGSDGLSEIVSGLVGQGLAIFDTIRGNVGTSARQDDDKPAIES